MGRNFALNEPQGEVGVSLEKTKQKTFFRETLLHFVTTQMQAVVTIYYHCMVFLLSFNGNTVNREIFARILFLRIALKSYLRLGHDLPISVNKRVIHKAFREDFIFRKLHICEVSRK